MLPCLDSCVQIGDQSARSDKFTPVSCKVQGSRAPDMLENRPYLVSRVRYTLTTLSYPSLTAPYAVLL